jgi:hypothetical protein
MISMIPARTRSELLEFGRAFYRALWADAHLIKPQRFNTCPLVRFLLARRIPRAPVPAARLRLSFASSLMHRAAGKRPA